MLAAQCCEPKEPKPCICAMAKSKQMSGGGAVGVCGGGSKIRERGNEAASEPCGIVVNLHFKCSAWQAQIPDANCCDLFSEDSSDVYEVVGCENANLRTCSVLLLLLFIMSNLTVPVVC